MSIENPTLAHFRHFSSLFTNLPSTTVEDSLQIGLFMQNKPNFPKSQMNVNTYNTKNYKNKRNWTIGQSKPNSNPIKPNYRKAKMNVNLTLTKDYIKYDDFAVQKNKPNSNPISVKPKMSANVFVTKDYENETAFRLLKNKPKQSQFPKGQNELKIDCRKIWPHPSKLRMKNNSLPWDQKGYNLPINPVFLAYRSNGSKCKVTEIYRYLLEG